MRERTTTLGEDDTPRRLVAAAVTQVAEHGWRGATARGITDAAGVNLALISYHFGGKRELLLAALDVVSRETVGLATRLLCDPSADLTALHGLQGAPSAAPVGSGAPDPGQMGRFLLAATREAVDDDRLRTAMRGVLEQLRTEVARASGLPTDDARVTLAVAALDGLFMHHCVDPDLPVADALTFLRGLIGSPTVGRSAPAPTTRPFGADASEPKQTGAHPQPDPHTERCT